MRIGINVPDELLRQVKEIRPDVNVSQVCRGALQHRVEVAQRAAAQATTDGVDGDVARLDEASGGPAIEPDWVAYALDDAREWTRRVTPENWEQFIHQSDVLRRQGRDETEMVNVWSRGGGKGYRARLDESADWFDSEFEVRLESGGGPDPYERAHEEYTRAWLGYVYEVRRRLEHRRKEEYDRVMAERAEYRRSRPGPEVPPQLL